MPFKPIVEFDRLRLSLAEQNLCAVFKVPSLRQHQVQTGQNTLKGISTILDVPTGGGKTLAFWEHGRGLPENNLGSWPTHGPAGVAGSGPLADLTEKGVPAVAISSISPDRDQLLQNVAENKYRVVLISPEMAVSTKFQSVVLSSELFTSNILSLVIDEAHCISEWGNDDFRPDFSKLSVLLSRMPSGVPVVAGSATMPKDVITDIKNKLGLRSDCVHVGVSNDKPNIALSVRIMQHPQDTFADLMTLFPRDAKGPEDFPQTLVYTDDRIPCEKIQDFLRRNSPDEIAEAVFEFYHRHVGDVQKKEIQDGIRSGRLRGASATDALGMGMDFKHIMRVILWHCPRSFLSLVQKIGRCGRAAELLGEAILYITSAAYMQYEIELEILKGDLADDEDEDAAQRQEPEAAADGEQMDREAAIEQEEQEPGKATKRKAKKSMTALEARDRRYLLEYIVTKGCRRIPWNKFFGNNSKLVLPHPAPPGARCCDNCSPDEFPVDTIRLTGAGKRTGRRQGTKTTEDVAAAIQETLLTLRDNIARTKYSRQNIVTGKILMSNLVVDALANRARSITSVEAINQTVQWVWATDLGAEVVQAIQQRLLDFPDLEEERREKAFAALHVLAEKDLRQKLTSVFDGCYTAVASEMVTRRGKSVKRCQIFMTLPKRNAWPDYYELIPEPISIAHINKFSHTTVIRSTAQYAALWHRLFDNARTYNRSDSVIYEDADYLQGVLDTNLAALSTLHDVPGP
ncbi:P-loop containing nucleoside triphosphate hydrolase protein [Mycena metata]|uniref:DNA 3'-5' helicase n=1 Tax=Mycena metata TaxID=1033252 RepID=A0AAD7M8N6_9AGAR|nr:P-loop containing nucleoside triphosphate hydrolase protein [Mycena metata]